MSTVKAAGYVIFRRIAGNIEYLLLQASSSSHHWTPPKGHVDPGENEEIAAVREVQEEAGYTASDLKVIPGFKKVVEYIVKNRPKTVTYWLAELIDPQKQVVLSNEHQDHKWACLEEACTLASYVTTQELLQECNNYLLNYKN